MATASKPERLHYTGNAEADRLIAGDPFALLMGFALDQQVPVPTAFSGPLKLKQRLGTLDPRKIATADPAKLEAAFREKPAIHRDRKSIRLNSSHQIISYAVFCLKKKNNTKNPT